MGPLKFTVLVVAFLTTTSVAGAATIDVPAAGQGWITQSGVSNDSARKNNYIVGNCGVTDCGIGEYRNFFVFDLRGLSNVTSAKLILDAFDVKALQSTAITYTVTSTGAQTFASLGAGAIYGSRDYTVADANQTTIIDLNAAALSGIASGGMFEISGRITSPTIFGPLALDQYIFGKSGGLATLELSGDGAPNVPMPEPAAWTLMIVGSGAIGLGLRNARKMLAT